MPSSVAHRGAISAAIPEIVVIVCAIPVAFAITNAVCVAVTQAFVIVRGSVGRGAVAAVLAKAGALEACSSASSECQDRNSGALFCDAETYMLDLGEQRPNLLPVLLATANLDSCPEDVPGEAMMSG